MEEKKLKWYEHEKVKIGYHHCLAPYDNICVGSYPMDGATKEWADQFDAIVNVSCNHSTLFEPSRPDQRTYWYPLNEFGEWSYAYFALMFKILDFHHSKGHKIYVHCAAGAYRSPSIVYRWLEYNGLKLLDAYEISRGYRLDKEDKNLPDEQRMLHYRLFSNYIFGNMPPNYQEFRTRLKHHNDNTGYTFVCALEGSDGRISNSPQVRAHRLTDNYKMSPTYWINKLKSKIEDLKRKYRLYIDCRKVIQIEKGYYITIREHDRIGSNRKFSMKEFIQ